MSLLLVNGLEKHYGAQDVLRGVTFQIDPGEKLGMVGRNGGGKSTLLRIVEGIEAPDRGSVTLRKGARLGHVPQRPEYEPGVTVREYVEAGLKEALETAEAFERAGEAMGHAQGVELERLMAEHERLAERMRVLGAWETDRAVETVLSGIGLKEELWSREARTLSGGEASRTALARELVAGHDLLLLDEPTNHLDLVGIEWIEAWLAELKGAVLIVSHDRRLLENAVDAILDLERGSVQRYPGNYSKYLVLRQERVDFERRAWQAQRELIGREETFIKKHMGSQRTAEAKGRQKKLSNLVRLEEPRLDVRRPVIPPPRLERGGELVLETRGLAGGYPGNVLFEGLDLRIGRGQRIGLVGPNGAGKSTLLKILAQRLAPLKGELTPGHGSLCGFYDQETSDLDEQATAYLELRRAHPEMTDLEIRSYLARFLFRGDEVDKLVAALSGGERARLSLAKLMRTEVSWLAMDEPTNHLDLAARTALEELLGAFDGALLCVSHDREFLDGLCTHVIEVRGGRAREFAGNYTAWRAARLAEQEHEATRRDELRAAQARRQKQVAPTPAAPAPSGSGRIRNPYQFAKLEQRIMTLEEDLGGLHEALTDEKIYRDPERLKETQLRISEVERELEQANLEWENWS